MKRFLGRAKWAVAVAGVFGAAATTPERNGEGGSPREAVKAVHTAFSAGASMLPVAAGPACAPPMRPESCAKAPQTPIGVLAQGTGELMQAGKDIGSMTLGILQTVYPGFEKKLAEQRAKNQPK